MAILTFPPEVRNPASVQIGLAALTQSGGRSPFDGTEQVLEMPGARWMAELRFVNLPLDQWRVLHGFVANLGGRAGRFYWGPTRWAPRRGTRGGAVTITGAAGKVIATTGWAPGGVAYAVRVGDYVGYVDGNGRDVMHLVTEDVFTDGAGSGGILLAPAVRRPPPVGTALNYTTPRAIWRLTSDENPFEFTGGPAKGAVSLRIEEALF
jgi:hypothetical protein